MGTTAQVGSIGEVSETQDSPPETPTSTNGTAKFPHNSKQKTKDKDPFELSKFSITINEEFKLDSVMKLVRSSDWELDPRIHLNAFAKLSKIWLGVPQAARDEIFQRSVKCVNRLKITPEVLEAPGGLEYAQNKRRIFNRILELDTEVDVRRALLWDPATFPTYTPEPWEEMYLGLPGWLGDFVRVHQYTEIPAPFIFWAGVALMGATCKFNLYIQMGQIESTFNQFIFLVGNSSSGKSHAKDMAMGILKRLNRQLNTRIVSRVNMSTQEVYRQDLWVNQLPESATVEAVINELDRIQLTPKFVVEEDALGDPVIITTPYNTDCSGILVVDEVATHFGRDNFGSDNKIPTYIALHSKDGFKKETSTRGAQTLRNLAFSMLVCGAPDWFKGALTPTIMKGGFLDRTLFIYRKHTMRSYSILELPVVDPIAADDLARDLIPIATSPSSLRRMVSVMEGAAIMEKQIYDRDKKLEHESQDNPQETVGLYRRSAVRRQQHRLKLAGLLAISECPTSLSQDFETMDIGSDNVELAKIIMEEEEKYFRRFLELVNLGGDAEVYCRIRDVMGAKDWRIKRSDLTARLHRTLQQVKSSLDLNGYLRILEEGEVLKKLKVASISKKGGRPTEVWTCPAKSKKVWKPYCSGN